MAESPPDAGRRSAALAMEPERFRALGHALVDRLTAELARLATRPVTPGETVAEVRHALDAARGLPAHGEDAATLLERASSLLFEHSTLGGHPRFHGYIAASPAPIGMLAELLAAALNANVALWQAAPMASEIELQTVRWLAELVGCAAGSGGLLTSGGNAANGMALQLALGARLPDVREQGLGTARCAVYACDQTHGWLPKALEQAGLGRRALRSVASDARQCIDLDALSRAIAADRAAGVQPLMLVGNAGSIATGAVDPLPALAALARREDLWFHVDGAYGAPAACLLGSPQVALLGASAAAGLAALREADSLALDPHKWLYAPIEAGCLLVREPQRLRDSYGQRPSYYAAPVDGEADAVDFHELGPQNTRAFRALKVWLALRMAGRDGYRQMIAGDIALARRLFERVQATPGLEAATQGLSVATWRCRPPQLADDAAALDALNRAVLARVQRGGRSYLSPAVVDGRLVLRACIVNFHTTAADVDALPALVAATAAAVVAR